MGVLAAVHLTSVLPACCQRHGVTAKLQVLSSSKGFGEGGGKGSKQAVKVSKRGKVASRQDPKQRLQQLQEQQDAYEASLAASRAASPSSQPTSSASRPAAVAAVDTEDDPDSKYAAMPQQVTDRMLKRILIFSGVPVFTGIALFPFFYFLKITQGLDLPTWVVYIVSTLTFGGGLFGITYGIMSSSWDPRREGSALGITEFKANLPLLMDRFKRD